MDDSRMLLTLECLTLFNTRIDNLSQAPLNELYVRLSRHNNRTHSSIRIQDSDACPIH